MTTIVYRQNVATSDDAGQIDLLNRSYAALTESVYSSLVLQTRLRPYMDAMELVFDDSDSKNIDVANE